jgi:hypothetical protein
MEKALETRVISISTEMNGKLDLLMEGNIELYLQLVDLGQTITESTDRFDAHCAELRADREEAKRSENCETNHVY